MNNEGQGGTMKRRLRAYKKTVSIVNEKAIELYKGLGIEKKGFLLEGTDKESGQYTFMGVEPNEIIQSDKDSLVITRKDGSREVDSDIIEEKQKEVISLPVLMKELGSRKIDGILLEGGGQLNESALQAGIVQRVYCYIAPKIFGGAQAKTPVEGQGLAKSGCDCNVRNCWLGLSDQNGKTFRICCGQSYIVIKGVIEARSGIQESRNNRAHHRF